MYQYNRKIEIRWIANPSVFEKINSKIINKSFRKLGSSITAVEAIISNFSEIESVMPEVLNISVSSPEFKKMVKVYFDSLTVDIPETGKVLEIGFNFNAFDKTFESKISQVKLKANIAQDADLDKEYGKAVIKMLKAGAIKYEELYQYAKPINPADYILWRYCQRYYRVAKDADDIKKSKNIDFFIYDSKAVKEEAIKLDMAVSDAMDIAIAESKDAVKLNSYISIFKLSPVDNSVISKKSALINFVTLNPTTFLNVAKSGDLEIKAKIAELIKDGTIVKQEYSDMYTLANNREVLIGDSDESMVKYFKENPDVFKTT